MVAIQIAAPRFCSVNEAQYLTVFWQVKHDFFAIYNFFYPYRFLYFFFIRIAILCIPHSGMREFMD